MKYLNLIFFILLQIPLAINSNENVIDNYESIEQLKDINKDLLNRIEKIEESQKNSEKKITELFNLIEYIKSSDNFKKTILKEAKEERAAKKLYTNAINLLETNQYQKAINSFIEYINIYPERENISDSYYWLGKAYAIQKDYGNATKTFIKFQNLYRSHYKFSNSLYELAVIHNKLNKNKEAKKLLEDMIERFPNHNLIDKAKNLLLNLDTE
jgi:tol-pal system protein YbgF